MTPPTPTVDRVASGATACNVYRVGDALVDVGTDADALPDADRVLLTHSHADHVAALAAYRDRTGATVHCHPDERAYALDRRDYLADSVAAHGYDGTAVVDAIADAEPLEDGEVVPVGPPDDGDGADAAEAVAVLHTPGHTPGSLSFAVPGDAEAVLCGDVVDGDGRPGRTDGDGADAATLAESIDRLAKREPAVLHPGHGGAVEDVPAALQLARSLV